MARKQPAQVSKPPEPEAEVPSAAPAAEPVYAAELAPCLGNWPDLEPRDVTLPGRSVRGVPGLSAGVSN